MENRQVEVKIAESRNDFSGNETIKIDSKFEIGTFQCWEQYKDDEFSKVYAIIELKNGTVGRYDIDKIKFIL